MLWERWMSTNDVKIFLSHYPSHRPREESDRTEGATLDTANVWAWLSISRDWNIQHLGCCGLKSELKVNFAKIILQNSSGSTQKRQVCLQGIKSHLWKRKQRRINSRWAQLYGRDRRRPELRTWLTCIVYYNETNWNWKKNNTFGESGKLLIIKTEKLS